MRFRTLEIRWHDSKPIQTCDFQPVTFKKARHAAGQETSYAAQSYRLATGGDDNHVRVWMVHPNINPTTTTAAVPDPTTTPGAARPPRIEYLATLSRHSAAVNVVRFCPNGQYRELIASAGDDGMIIIWAPSATPQATTYGSDLSPEEMQHEKEYWKPRTTFRCGTMQVYDLAWSPSGEYIVAGSTDNVARIFSSHDGKCLHELAEHSHFVQGVAWDPMNEYIATQSSDRSMHIYHISFSRTNGALEVHAVGKNTRMQVQHQRHRRTSSHNTPRPRMFRSESAVSITMSDAESAISDFRDEVSHLTQSRNGDPLTPATSIASTPTMFPPPPISLSDKPPQPTPSSRRSSISSTAPSPQITSSHSRYGRSPSPMPALPAIRQSPVPMWSSSSVKLYGDEGYCNFFRRLGFSPDGGLLMTPAGQFEDPAVVVGGGGGGTGKEGAGEGGTPKRGRKGKKLSVNTNTDVDVGTTSSVYIYSRANFARPPIAQLPGHRKASVGVRFSPVLYELRQGVSAASGGTAMGSLDAGKGRDVHMAVDVFGPTTGAIVAPTSQHLAAPVPRPALSTSPLMSPVDRSQPALSPVLSRAGTPAVGLPSTSLLTPSGGHSSALTSPSTASIFALPYRMLFAVVTMDAVAIYDTQQAGPVCLLSKLHYDEFTDMSWSVPSSDGQCLILSARDGYCTIVIFDEILPAHHTQQHTLQMQSIAQHHSVPLTTTSSVPRKRNEPTPSPVKPATSGEGERDNTNVTMAISSSMGALSESESMVSVSSAASVSEEGPERPKKKRRVALTRVGDIGP
ncbi:WD40-repeat-containing domain protein [Pterulicium gracile]|uniref:WD40-repeat-containing domain protein n=1 Tax=Pterulicium gracile TaxID=1884261 RepID=A0A5C3QB49_9AGAR|nr:WD40-repeat-containing domain protein [Pterula gracilis]